MDKQRYTELENLLNRTENGRELYEKSAVFHTCIDMLLTGSDSVAIIEKLCTMNEEVTQSYKDYIATDARPFFVPKDWDIDSIGKK